MNNFDAICSLYIENFEEITLEKQLVDKQKTLIHLYRRLNEMGLSDTSPREIKAVENALKSKIEDYVDFTNRHMDEILVISPCKDQYLHFQKHFKELLSIRDK